MDLIGFFHPPSALVGVSHQHVVVSGPSVGCVGERQRQVIHPPLIHLLQVELSYLLSFKEVNDLVVGEEPGEGGEGSHHPLEGDDCLFHVTVQEQDRSSRETAEKNFHKMFCAKITSNMSNLTIQLTHFLHMPKFKTFVMSGIVK